MFASPVFRTKQRASRTRQPERDPERALVESGAVLGIPVESVRGRTAEIWSSVRRIVHNNVFAGPAFFF